MGADGLQELAAAVAITDEVLALVQRIPVAKGMAGLAAERAEPVTACNLQTDTTGDVRPGAKATGLEGSIVVPVLDANGAVVGTLGVANRAPRTFTDDEIATLSPARILETTRARTRRCEHGKSDKEGTNTHAFTIDQTA